MANVYFDITIDGEAAGRVVFKLFDNVVPKTAQNFRDLALGVPGYGYRGCGFHRIIPLFMAQGGDFTHHNGSGGRSSFGIRFADEGFTIGHSRPFLLSMANSGPNTNTSQFFITLKAAPHLDGKHVVFGEVVEGQKVVRAIEMAGTESGRPRVRVSISACGTV